MTEIMPVPRNSNITVLRPPSIYWDVFLWKNDNSDDIINRKKLEF